MFEIPDRASLAAVSEAANAIVPTLAFGFVRVDGDNRVTVLFCEPYGISQHKLTASELPDALVPRPAESQYNDALTIQANPDGAIQWLLIAMGAHGIISTPMPRLEPTTRFWIALSEAIPPAPEQLHQIESVARSSAPLDRQPQ